MPHYEPETIQRLWDERDRLAARVLELEKILAAEGGEATNRYQVMSLRAVREALKAAGLWRPREDDRGGTGDCAVDAIERLVYLEARVQLLERADREPLERIAALEHHIDGIRQRLRIECAELGDNDWPDNLHLADVIDLHLARPAAARIEELENEVEAGLRGQVEISESNGRMFEKLNARISALEAENTVLREALEEAAPIVGAVEDGAEDPPVSLKISRALCAADAAASRSARVTD